MDCPPPVAQDDGDLSWSDSHTMESDDVQSAGLPSPWLAPLLTTGSTLASAASSIASFSHTGQLSPISNGNGVHQPGGAAAASPSQSPPPMSAAANPALASVRLQRRSLAYTVITDTATRPVPVESHGFHQLVAWDYVEEEEGEEEEEEEAETDEADEEEGKMGELLTVPKLEPLDGEDFCMHDLQEPPPPPPPSHTLSAHSRGTPVPPPPKRPRGRPRKHPLIPNVASNKITKGRSKTGCLTCRKRKKKCDEAKPRCMNCEKNAVVCEGYPEKQIWKSGREKAEEERLRTRSFPSITMLPLFPGLETVEDMIFWKHYNEHLSAVLTVEGEHKNAFKDTVIPVAVKHQGLMHSILSLASKHIDFETPYGHNILRNNPTTSLEALRERSDLHHYEARQKFYDDIKLTNREPNLVDRTLILARYGQMLCFLLEALVDGSVHGEHRPHLTAYRNLISTSPPGDSTFLSFVAEFFQYHIFADELIHSAIDGESYAMAKPLPPIPSIHPPRLLGVADGLLGHLSEITAIRNTIRRKIMAQIDPVVDYEDLYPAADIDAAIREWTPHWPPGDSRDQVGLLYKQMMWIYLQRTVYPPSTSTPSSMASSAVSLSLIHSSPSHGRPAPSAVDTPPQSASTSCASSPRTASAFLGGAQENPRQDAPSRPPGHGSHPDASAGSRASSPPPARNPPHLDPRVTLAVDESLALLESFKPSDPCQTLLLLPCFLVGTACFSRAQQRRVRAAICTVRGYTGLRNADRLVELLEEVWRLMDAGDWVGAWDWPSVAQRLKLDFIPA